MEIQRGIYGLPHAGILANKKLTYYMKKEGYYEVPHTPGSWKHYSYKTRSTLLVYYFGIKYQIIENCNCIIKSIKKYQVEVDWTGGL